MAHPYNEHRQDKVEHRRAGEMVKGHASGGHVDEAEDRKLIKGMVKTAALKADGAKAKARLDRPNRAKGGRVGKTTVNIMVGKGEDKPVPVPAMPPAMSAPSMPPPSMPPAMPPGMPPPVMRPGMPPMHANGGRVKRAAGGAVKSGPTWNEGRDNGTKVTHSPGKNDTDLIDYSRAKLTRKTGGRIEAGKSMGPKMHAGDNGVGRLEKAAMQRRK